MNNNEELTDNIELNQENLNLISQFIGQSKFNVLFLLNSGELYSYNPLSMIDIDGQEISLNYLLELIELLNTSKIEILEINVE